MIGYAPQKSTAETGDCGDTDYFCHLNEIHAASKQQSATPGRSLS
jgi:hypothetical protein